MLNELKPIHAAAYLTTVGLVFAIITTGIQPMLLNSPPKGFTLAAVAGLLAAMFYVLSMGPMWVANRATTASFYIRANAAILTLAVGLAASLCDARPKEPAVASTGLESRNKATPPNPIV